MPSAMIGPRRDPKIKSTQAGWCRHATQMRNGPRRSLARAAILTPTLHRSCVKHDYSKQAQAPSKA